MAEEQGNDERPLVERWLEDQQEWQKTMLRYMDSMANNEEFLVHLGNAMRGSLLAGKPYPGTAGAAAAEPAPEPGAAAPAPDDRLDRILFALHEIQGQLNDLHLTVDRLAAKLDASPGGSHNNNNDADVRHVAPAGHTDTGSATNAMHDRSARGRSPRKAESVSSKPKMRRSQPRSAFSRRGDTD